MTDLLNSNQKEPKISNFELGTEIGSIRSQNTKYKQKLNHNNQQSTRRGSYRWWRYIMSRNEHRRTGTGSGSSVLPQAPQSETLTKSLSNFIPSVSHSPTKFNVPLPAHELSQTTARLASPRSSPRKSQQSKTLGSADPFQNLPNLTYSKDRPDSHTGEDSNTIRDHIESPYDVNYQGPITLDYLRYVCKMLTSVDPRREELTEAQAVANATPPSSSRGENRISTPEQNIRSDTVGASAIEKTDLETSVPTTATLNQIESRSQLETLPDANKPEKKRVSYLQKILLAQTAKAEKLKSTRKEAYNDEKKSNIVSQEFQESVLKSNNGKPVRKKRKIIGTKPDFTIDVARHESGAAGSPAKHRVEKHKDGRSDNDANNHFFNKHGASFLKSPEVEHDVQAAGAVGARVINQHPKPIADDAENPNILPSNSALENVISDGPTVNSEQRSPANSEEVERVNTLEQGHLESNQQDKSKGQVNDDKDSAYETHRNDAFIEAKDLDQASLEAGPSNNTKTQNKNSNEAPTPGKDSNEMSNEKRSFSSDGEQDSFKLENTKDNVLELESEDKISKETEETERVQLIDPSHEGSVSKQATSDKLQDDIPTQVDQNEAVHKPENLDSNDVDDEVILVDRDPTQTSTKEIIEESDEVSKKTHARSPGSESDPNTIVSENHISTETIPQDTEVDQQNDSKLNHTGSSQTENIFSILRNKASTEEVEIDTFHKVDLSDEQPTDGNSANEPKDEEFSILEVDLITRKLLSHQKLDLSTSDSNSPHTDKLPNSILQLIQSNSNDFLLNLMNSLKLYAFSRDSHTVDVSDLILYLRQINFGGTGETMGDIERIFDIAQDNFPLELIIELENSIEKALSELEAGDEGGLFIENKEVDHEEEEEEEEEKENNDEIEESTNADENDNNNSNANKAGNERSEEFDEDIDFKNKSDDDDDVE
ncbi:hypothetical protein CORT_0A07620 [Candida orthopsilosis Co 90-125]|uniref:Uncharacterized protein n=1 Tax=Candida orthopsilosis (strain 90-125) TaxID=1136231 RepID=H8WX08_CANO9|nr:hypothetical protein CORT_0A07620 [Candida orthopsilosis Co 90-125]CCG21148.1 hypothetical protein CORT_0A07620 [Candida orthopsilosis Co 90-125]